MASRFAALRPWVFLPLALVLLPACDGGDDAPEGLDYDRLFAAPTATEVDAVAAEWAARTNPVRDAAVVDTADVDGATLYVVAHTQTGPDGADFTHYGLVRVPDGAAALPVLVYHHGGDDGLSASGFLGVVDLFPDLAAQTVQVAPVYRSEPLVADVKGLGGTYTAGGAPSPWDYDVDDAIGLLNAAFSLFPGESDAERVAALGISRGGNTALLHAVRDDRVDAVTDYFGPADFFNFVARFLAFELAQGDPDVLGLPGAEYLTEEVLDPLAEGALSYEEARLELVRRSPGLFGERLPDTQLHHHVEDPVVPVGFSEAFIALVATNPVDGVFGPTLYDNALPAGAASYHDPAAMPESLPATEAFLEEHAVGAALLP
jgi:hypothetical protein